MGVYVCTRLLAPEMHMWKWFLRFLSEKSNDTFDDQIKYILIVCFSAFIRILIHSHDFIMRIFIFVQLLYVLHEC